MSGTSDSSSTSNNSKKCHKCQLKSKSSDACFVCADCPSTPYLCAACATSHCTAAAGHLVVKTGTYQNLAESKVRDNIASVERSLIVLEERQETLNKLRAEVISEIEDDRANWQSAIERKMELLVTSASDHLNTKEDGLARKKKELQIYLEECAEALCRVKAIKEKLPNEGARSEVLPSEMLALLEPPVSASTPNETTHLQYFNHPIEGAGAPRWDGVLGPVIGGAAWSHIMGSLQIRGNEQHSASSPASTELLLSADTQHVISNTFEGKYHHLNFGCNILLSLDCCYIPGIDGLLESDGPFGLFRRVNEGINTEDIYRRKVCDEVSAGVCFLERQHNSGMSASELARHSISSVSSADDNGTSTSEQLAELPLNPEEPEEKLHMKSPRLQSEGEKPFACSKKPSISISPRLFSGCANSSVCRQNTQTHSNAAVNRKPAVTIYSAAAKHVRVYHWKGRGRDPRLIRQIPIEGAECLRGIAVTKTGRLAVVDERACKIVVLGENEKVEVCVRASYEYSKHHSINEKSGEEQGDITAGPSVPTEETLFSSQETLPESSPRVFHKGDSCDASDRGESKAHTPVSDPPTHKPSGSDSDSPRNGDHITGSDDHTPTYSTSSTVDAGIESNHVKKADGNFPDELENPERCRFHRVLARPGYVAWAEHGEKPDESTIPDLFVTDKGSDSIPPSVARIQIRPHVCEIWRTEISDPCNICTIGRSVFVTSQRSSDVVELDAGSGVVKDIVSCYGEQARGVFKMGTHPQLLTISYSKRKA